MHLHRHVAGLVRLLRGEHFRHRPFPGEGSSRFLESGGAQREQPRGVQGRRDVGQGESDGLVIGDRLTEGVPLLRVADRGVERGGTDADGLAGDAYPPRVERAERDGKSASLRAEHRVRGHAQVLERERDRAGSAQPHLVLMPADVETLVAAFHEKAADPPVALDARARPDDDHSRAIAGGDPLLAAVDHVLTAVEARCGAQRRRIRACVRLREAEARGDEAARGDLRKVALLLRLRAVPRDRLRNQVVHRHGHGGGGTALGDLHHGQRIGDCAGLRSAVLFGDVDAHHPELGELGQLLLRKPAFPVQLAGDGSERLLRVIARRIADELLRFGQFEESGLHRGPQLHGDEPRSGPAPM